MENENTGSAARKFSVLLIIFFIFFWICTLPYITAGKTFFNRFPLLYNTYKLFVRQDWKLFYKPHPYNRHIQILLIDSLHPQHTDTIDLVKYIQTQKRRYAPFNNYEDGLDNLLFRASNYFESQLRQKKEQLKKENPAMADSLCNAVAVNYMETDHKTKVATDNITNFSKYLLRNMSVDTTGKIYRLVIFYEPIMPYYSNEYLSDSYKIQTVYVSSLKHF